MIARIAGIVLAFTSPALADDHMIHPTCWEENVNGQAVRHCAVNGVDPGEHRIRQAPGPVAPVPVPAPQVEEAAVPPPPAAIPRPPYPPPPPYYRPPGRLGIAGPLAVIRFGPITVVVP